VLKPNASLLRVLEKTILHDEIILQEKHKEVLKDTPITDVLWDKPYNHAFLYTVYGNEIYLTYLRYSIMSLRMVSPQCKIMVFVEAKLWRKAKEELKGLLFDHDIVRVNGEAACYKQVITCHTLIKDFKWCTFVDADLFFLGEVNSLDDSLYRVKKLLSNNPYSFVWAFGRKESPNVSHTFMHKRGREDTLRPHTYAWDLEEELDMDIETLIETEKVWNISFIFSFCPKVVQTDDYKSWVLYSLLDNNMCDESIWWLWSKKKKWKSYYWGLDLPNLSISSETHESDKKVHLFQPMFTDTMQTKTHRKYETFMAILEIEDKYKEWVENLNVDWWEAPPKIQMEPTNLEE